ncbi:MAG: ATP-binding protein [Saccharofermentanales bacterium]
MASDILPKRITGAIINSFTTGVVPRIGLEHVTVGRKNEIHSLLDNLDTIQEGGGAFRFIIGKYGSGKSFLLQLLRNHAMERGFVVLDSDLSPDRRFFGSKGQGLATYQELVRNLSTKAKPDGGALTLLIERWILAVQNELIQQTGLLPSSADFSSLVEKRIFDKISQMEGMIHGFDFSKVLIIYYKAYMDGQDETKSFVLKWLRGEYPTKTEARKDLGVNNVISDDTWYDYLKLLSQFVVLAGYKGLIVLVDELVNLYKIPHNITRQNNYEKILTIFNDTMQGKAGYIGFFMGGTPQFLEDTRRGIYSYEALRSRLEAGRFAQEQFRDLQAPVLRLNALTNEELYLLVERLSEIHAMHYQYAPFIKKEDLLSFINIEWNRMGADTHITPREVVRDFLEVLNILYQNPSFSMDALFENSGFSFNKPAAASNEDDICEEFAEFEF